MKLEKSALSTNRVCSKSAPDVHLMTDENRLRIVALLSLAMLSTTSGFLIEEVR